MLDTDTIAACRHLLGLYKGVTVDHCEGHPSGKASFILRITEPATVTRIAYHASDACVDFLVWPVGHAWPVGEEVAHVDPVARSEADLASPERIRYQLRAEPPSGESPELRVVTLGVCMAEELARLGLLDRAEADRLRAGWGF